MKNTKIFCTVFALLSGVCAPLVAKEHSEMAKKSPNSQTQATVGAIVNEIAILQTDVTTLQSEVGALQAATSYAYATGTQAFNVDGNNVTFQTTTLTGDISYNKNAGQFTVNTAGTYYIKCYAYIDIYANFGGLDVGDAQSAQLTFSYDAVSNFFGSSGTQMFITNECVIQMAAADTFQATILALGQTNVNTIQLGNTPPCSIMITKIA